MICLNITSITDEIFALTALHNVVFENQQPPQPLTRDNLPALRIIVRAAFSTVTSLLQPYLTDSNIDEASPSAELPYSDSAQVTLNLDFGSYTAGLSTSALLLLRRQLEHLIALHAIAAVYAPQNASSGNSRKTTYSGAIATSALTEAAALLISLRDRLSAEQFPLTITPAYY